MASTEPTYKEKPARGADPKARRGGAQEVAGRLMSAPPHLANADV